jgi:hypothetical protein
MVFATLAFPHEEVEPMQDRVRRGLSYANVMSTMAVFAVLGGGAYAAGTIGAKDIKRNAVRAKHIKKNQVGSRHLKRNAVTAAKLAGGAVGNRALGNAAVSARNVANGAIGASQLGDGSVSDGKLANGAVTNSKLGDGAVTNPKLADGAVTGAKVDESTLGPVPEADRLDGLDSMDFMRGAGRAHGGVLTDPEGGPATALDLDIGGTLALECRNPASVSSSLVFTNNSGATADVWAERMQGTPLPVAPTVTYSAVASGGNASIGISGPVVLSGESRLKFTIAVGARIAVVDARLVYAGGACRAPASITELRG